MYQGFFCAKLMYLERMVVSNCRRERVVSTLLTNILQKIISRKI